MPLKFWSLDKWKRDFLQQLRFANSLLKIYSASAISAALRSPAGKNVYSLGAKWLDPAIKREQERIDKEQARLTTAPVIELPPEPIKAEPPREGFIGADNTLITKLRKLD